MVAEEIEVQPEFEGLGLRITAITDEARRQQEAWPRHYMPDQRIFWDWDELLALYRRSENDRVEMAVWVEGELCGMALGKVSAGKLIVRVNFVQGSTVENHPLKGRVFTVVDAYLEQYAVALGVGYIGVQDPYEGVKPYYAQFGYEDSDPFDPRNNAMVRAVEID